MRPRLQRLVTGVFVGLYVGLCLTIVGYWHARGTGVVLSLSDVILEQVADSVVAETSAWLTPARVSASLIAGEVGDPADPEERARLLAYLERTLLAYPQFYSAYVGFADGSYLQVATLPPPENPVRADAARYPGVVPEAARLHRWLDRTGPVPTETLSYVAADGRALADVRRDRVTYDPRERPWYRRGAEGPAWSDIYVYYTSGRPGVTAAHPVHGPDGTLRAVAATDVLLADLSSFLAGLSIGRSGVALLVDPQRRVVAHPDAERLVIRDGDDWRPLTLDELGRTHVSEAVARWEREESDDFHFVHDGVETMARFRRLPDDVGAGWTLAIVVPVDDFVGVVHETNRHVLAFALGVLAIGVLAVGLIGRELSRPIRALADEARRITDLQLYDDVEVSSRIAEVSDLQRAMATMKRALHDFGRFVPRALVAQLVRREGGISLGGERRRMVVLFTDIAGFTSIAESMEPEPLALQMSEYFTTTTAVLHAHGAVIDKFIGDSVMAFWGAPTADPDMVRRACEGALAAHRAIERLNVRWAAEGRPTLPTRFGLHVGEAIVGTVGSDERMDYTVLGDTVNLASRVEGLAGRYGEPIVVTVAIVEAWRDTVGDPTERFRRLGSAAVKGRRGPVEIFALR